MESGRAPGNSRRGDEVPAARGAAYYVFDHFIWRPYRAGDLHGFTHMVKIAKAALAALFVYHEVELMAGDVKNSKTLSFLTAPIPMRSGSWRR